MATLTLPRRKKKKAKSGKFPNRPPEHDKWSLAVKTRDGFKCQECPCTDRKDLHAHHKKSWTTHPHLRFVLDNGITLCIRCHAKRHPEMKDFMLGKKRKKARKLNKLIKLLK